MTDHDKLFWMTWALAFFAGMFANAVSQKFQGWIAFWRMDKWHRALHAQARLAFQNRKKGRIVKVGRLSTGPDGKLKPLEFEIEVLQGVLARQVGPDGEMCQAGYTEEELIEIAKQGKEFET